MRLFLAWVMVFALAAGLVAGATGQEKTSGKAKGDEHLLVKPGDLKWGPGPASLPPGAQMAVLAGDPSKPGTLFTIRAKLPDGYVVPRHWHPTDENVTVLAGTLLITAGDEHGAQELPAGSYMRMPKEMRHSAKAKGETILQVHGVGPFEIHYVNSVDDPRNKDKKK